jgi:hypothetical protein
MITKLSVKVERLKSKDEGGRMKDESVVLSARSVLSSFIPHPSALLFKFVVVLDKSLCAHYDCQRYS